MNKRKALLRAEKTIWATSHLVPIRIAFKSKPQKTCETEEFKFIGVYLSHSIKIQNRQSRGGVPVVSAFKELGLSILSFTFGVLVVYCCTTTLPQT